MIRIITDENGRFLRGVGERFETNTGTLVDEYSLPTGDLAEYRLINGEWVYDPVKNDAPQETESLQDIVEAQRTEIELLKECILELSETVYA